MKSNNKKFKWEVINESPIQEVIQLHYLLEMQLCIIKQVTKILCEETKSESRNPCSKISKFQAHIQFPITLIL